ncbi:hypothetical protein [Algoriphagus hitonicola]|uniref:Uncharacterized protein n=1 Tax=Algoriphagus hitonicola TaxID=435880 RepID=A0A1I2XAU3_9BACT|nr:hypothetical protein [Algoriphagus hitonicola]SFH09806.1 hypothetical protein SAMN04487988_11712 [Algoriphagus hitonicola]
MRVIIAILILITPTISYSQDYEEHDVEEFYKKIELESGTLDEDGDEIDFIFVETELDQGQYEIEITDGPGDLYEIKGTDYFIKFKFYYGYAGYGEEGILDVGTSAWSSTFYKKE